MPRLVSTDYIQALRSGDYLRFLQWPSFLLEEHDVIHADADTLITIVVFNWLKSGFTEEDVKHIAILNAILQDEDSPLSGRIAYIAVSLIVAAQQCMVFKAFDLIDFYYTDQRFNKDDLLQWMTQDNLCLNAEQNAKQLACQIERLSLLKYEVQNEIDVSSKRLQSMLAFWKVTDHYIELLEIDNRERPDKIKAIRLGIAKALQYELQDYTQETEEMFKLIVHYINRLIEQNPQPWEEKLLKEIVPKSWQQQLLHWSQIKAVTFFNHVLFPLKPEGSEGLITASESEPKPE